VCFYHEGQEEHEVFLDFLPQRSPFKIVYCKMIIVYCFLLIGFTGFTQIIFNLFLATNEHQCPQIVFFTMKDRKNTKVFFIHRFHGFPQIIFNLFLATNEHQCPQIVFYHEGQEEHEGFFIH